MAVCLIVEDSESMREVASEILSGLGHDVREAADAAAGLATCEGTRTIDAVLLDWDLPGLGALDFMRGAAALDPRPTSILCATENDARQFGLARAVGAGFHVLKPYDRESIAEVMADAGFEAGQAVA